jgi:7-methyl-GTP pyrophosphatase
VSPPPLILASSSPYRRALLERLGVSFGWEAPVDHEEMLKQLLTSSPPRELAIQLSVAKAQSVAKRHPASVVLGGDQLVVLRGLILGKPGDLQSAREQLQLLSGSTHELHTAFAIAHGDKIKSHVNIARMSMRRLSSQEIDRYVESENPVDCAGSYKFELRGIALFDRIACSDHSAISGLPLIRLSRMLRAFGYQVP